RLLWVEQTSNLGGGSVWSLERIKTVVGAGRRHNLVTHMDGARLMNAVVASGVSARAYAEPFDSTWSDFTKGLGAPVGAALAGARRESGGLAGRERRGVGLQASDGRNQSSSGDQRGRRRLRAAPSRRAHGGGSRECAASRGGVGRVTRHQARPGGGRDQYRVL